MPPLIASGNSGSLPPGSMGLPIIGESVAYKRDPEFVAKRQQKYGPMFKSQVFGHKVVFMLGRDANRCVLATAADHFSSAAGYPGTMATLFGSQAPFMLDGDPHRQMRQLWAPFFSLKTLSRAVPKIEAICTDRSAAWQVRPPADWQRAFRHLTMEIIGKLLFGETLVTKTAGLCHLSAAVSRSMSPFLPLHWRRYRWIKALRARDRLLVEIKQSFEHKQTNFMKDVLHHFDGCLDKAASHMLFLLFAGHETLSTMLLSIKARLEDQPAIRLKLSEDVARLTPPTDIDQLQRMDWLNRFLWEVERCHPTIQGLFRGVERPFKWLGHTVPAGWLVSFRLAETHQDNDVFSAATEFSPGRFCPHAHGRPDKFELIGFGGGAHMCPGKSLAQLIMKIVIIQLLQNKSRLVL